MGVHPACFFINRAGKIATIKQNSARKKLFLSCAASLSSRTNWQAPGSFFARARRGEFDLAGWDELWSLLVIITLRKCARRLREVKAARRDPRREIESRTPEYGGVWQVPDRAPSPVEAAILTETAEELFRQMHPDDRPIVDRGRIG
jgi:hypothetical protein